MNKETLIIIAKLLRNRDGRSLMIGKVGFLIFVPCHCCSSTAFTASYDERGVAVYVNTVTHEVRWSDPRPALEVCTISYLSLCLW